MIIKIFTNFFMAKTAILQFASECNSWKETLRFYRDELRMLQVMLQNAVNKPLSKDEQTELEHLQNQLHIQLINVHDLKHAVKLHDLKLSFEISGNTGSFFSDNVPAYHENLYSNYQFLENVVSELHNDIKHFVTAIQKVFNPV